MARLLLPLVALALAIGIIGLLSWIFDEAKAATVRANQQKLDDKRRRELKQLEDKRRTEEAIRIVSENAPELAALRKAVTVLRDFVARANAYRPTFSRPSDLSFRQAHFLFPFDVFFPHRDCEGTSDGPDPEPWIATIDNLLVSKAHDLRSIYERCVETNTFPCHPPILSFNPSPPPEYPHVELPLSSVDDAGTKFLVLLRKLFTFQLSQHRKLQEATKQLQNELVEQKRKAEEARELAVIHIANERSAYQSTQNSLMTEFNVCKRNYEQQSDEQLAPIRSVLQEYTTQTSSGIQAHFQLALRTLAIPIPSNFPWSTFYDANERLLQVNQRVPSIADIVVKRPDSKRPPSKKDTGNFLRRLVPAVSLHIAQHVALNDFNEDVDSIAVNCWCRYYERTTGQLKNAFVSSLKVQKRGTRPVRAALLR
jgi:hypothetical protein